MMEMVLTSSYDILCTGFQCQPLLRLVLISELMGQQRNNRKTSQEHEQSGNLRPPEWTLNDGLKQGIWVNAIICHSQAFSSWCCLFDDSFLSSCKLQKATLQSLRKTNISGALQYEGECFVWVCACVRVNAVGNYWYSVRDSQWETVCGSIGWGHLSERGVVG